MSEKPVYLTFDDGPSIRTGQLLDVLRKYNAYATFFVIGEIIENHEDIIRRIASEGHTIGVHAYTHAYEKIYQSPEAFWQDNLLARKKIADITGIEPKIMRFPGGSSNTVSRQYCRNIMTTLTAQAKDYGYEYFDWNIHPDDITIDADKVEEIYGLLINDIHEDYKTPVILLHDINLLKLKKYPQIIEKVLKACTEEGYVFKALDENIPPVHHMVAN